MEESTKMFVDTPARFMPVLSLSKETVLELYGMAPRLCLPAQQCGGQLAFLPTTHRNLFCMILHHLEKPSKHCAQRGEESAFVHIIASGLSGLTATISSHPFDVVRTKLANQPVKNPVYNGMTDCVLKVAKTQGISGLYKGFLPRYGRLGPWQLIFWCVYEKALVLATGENFSWD